jgi:hypothetical protein
MTTYLQNKKVLPVVFFLLINSSAVLANDLGDDISRFNGAAAKIPNELQTFYAKANETQRHLYLLEVRLHPGAELKSEVDVKPPQKLSDDRIKQLKELNIDPDQYLQIEQKMYQYEMKDFPNGKSVSRTGLTNYYSQDFINVRLKAMQGISLYTRALNSLAGSTAPADESSAVANIGTQISGLSTAIGKIDPNNKALNFSNFSTPIAEIAATIANAVLTHLKNKWVSQSIGETQLNFGRVCYRMRDDTRSVAEVLRNRISATTALYEDYYNNGSKLKNLSVEDEGRANFLSEMEKITSLQADTEKSNPVSDIETLLSLHDTLVSTYSKNGEGNGYKQLKKFEDPEKFASDI